MASPRSSSIQPMTPLTLLIDNQEAFHQIFKTFKEDARVRTPESANDRFIVGFDTEYVSWSHRVAIEHKPKWILSKEFECRRADTLVCVVSLASPSYNLVIPLRHLGPNLPKQLFNIITQPSWIKVGVNVDADLKNLSENYNLFHCSGGIDMQNVALLQGLANTKLETLWETLCGQSSKTILQRFPHVSSSQQNWSCENLSQPMIDYAAQDARLSLEIGRKLLSVLSTTPKRRKPVVLPPPQLPPQSYHVLPPQHTLSLIKYSVVALMSSQGDNIILPVNHILNLCRYMGHPKLTKKQLNHVLYRCRDVTRVDKLDDNQSPMWKYTPATKTTYKPQPPLPPQSLSYQLRQPPLRMQPQALQTPFQNTVGHLNEVAQRMRRLPPKYTFVSQVLTSDSTMEFTMRCTYEGNAVLGVGLSKKKAKQDAARQMFCML